LGFFNSVIDVLIIAFIIYKAYKFISGTQAAQLLRGAGYLALVWGVAYILKLNTLLWILSKLGPGIVIALAIVLQPELRQIIMKLGLTQIFRPGKGQKTGEYLQAVINAAETLSACKRGALIVFPRKSNINSIIATGTRINAEISSALLVTIFRYNTPLHDGAVVIQNGKIAAAGCLLPLSVQREVRKSFGTRHRAALGASETSDSVILIVSEETGAISLAFDSQIAYQLPSGVILQKLSSLLDGSRGRGKEAQNTGEGKAGAGETGEGGTGEGKAGSADTGGEEEYDVR